MLAGCAPIPDIGPLFGPDNLMTILLIAVIVLLICFFRSWRGVNKCRAQASTETILSERYARTSGGGCAERCSSAYLPFAPWLPSSG